VIGVSLGQPCGHAANVKGKKEKKKKTKIVLCEKDILVKENIILHLFYIYYFTQYISTINVLTYTI